MSAETPNPQPGDRVRVTFEATYLRPHVKLDGCHEVHVPDDSNTRVTLRSATIEVLERADDPSKDPLDSVRIGPNGAVAIRMHVERDGNRYVPGWRLTRGAGECADKDVVGWQRVGVLPGGEEQSTPRPSVRLSNEPHGVPTDIREVVAGHVLAGAFARAQRTLVHNGLADDYADAERYIQGMSEFQEFIDTNARTEVDPTEATRMGVMGFDKQPEFKLSDEDRALIRSVLDERASEYVYGGAHGWKWDSAALTGVVADIVYAVRVQDRKRGDR